MNRQTPSLLPHFFSSACSVLLLSAFAAFLLPSCSETESGTAAADTEGSARTAGFPLMEEEITYEADSVSMQGFLVYRGTKERRPGVLVVHEWWGHNEHARNAARKLAEAGYVALAVDMYGGGQQAAHPGEAAAFSGAVMQNFDGAKARFQAALEVLQGQGAVLPDQVAAIGYCFGGGIVLNMARQNMPLNAVVSFHGSLGPVEAAQAGAVQARVLVLNGAEDPFVPQSAIDAFQEEMQTAGVDFRFIDMPGAVHAFTNPAATEMGERFELPLAYNAEADSTSWALALEFLSESF
jgi:dienelactone hydrolase